MPSPWVRRLTASGVSTHASKPATFTLADPIRADLVIVTGLDSAWGNDLDERIQRSIHDESVNEHREASRVEMTLAEYRATGAASFYRA